MMVLFVTVSLTIWLWFRQLTIKLSLLLFGDANAHHFEWLEFVFLLIVMGVMLSNFAICKVVNCWCALKLSVPVSDLICHDWCFWHCRCIHRCPAEHSWLCQLMLRSEQTMPDCYARSTVFLEHFTNWDSVHNEVKSFTWSTIFKSPDSLEAFTVLLVMSLVYSCSTTVSRCRSWDNKWFDASCGGAYDDKHTSYRAWWRTFN